MNEEAEASVDSDTSLELVAEGSKGPKHQGIAISEYIISQAYIFLQRMIKELKGFLVSTTYNEAPVENK